MLVTSTAFNARGLAESVFDAYGRETRYTFDDSGGFKKVIQNYTDGDPSTGSPDEDVVTDYTYNSGRLLSTLTTTTRKADLSGVDVQTTKYVYGTSVGDSSPAVYRNDLVLGVRPSFVVSGRLRSACHRQGVRLQKSSLAGDSVKAPSIPWPRRVSGPGVISGSSD